MNNNFANCRSHIYNADNVIDDKNKFISFERDQERFKSLIPAHRAEAHKSIENLKDKIIINNYILDECLKLRESSRFTSSLEQKFKSKAKNLEKKNVVEKYLNLRNSHTRQYFGLMDTINIVCNTYSSKKIPKKSIEKFHFYSQAKRSVEHYFDFIFMIKKFEETNILKNCLLGKLQSQMVEIMSNPILSAKN